MKCPACGKLLQKMTVSNINVDVCKGGCGGLWFDQLELQRVDEPQESAGASLLNVARDPATKVDHSRRRTCPKCEGMLMMRHFFSAKKEAEVDECPSCGGFWLDCGELTAIRGQFDSETERKKAAEAYFEEIFGAELQGMKKESKEKLEKARSITRLFRFICPSSYIPDKQE